MSVAGTRRTVSRSTSVRRVTDRGAGDGPGGLGVPTTATSSRRHVTGSPSLSSTVRYTPEPPALTISLANNAAEAPLGEAIGYARSGLGPEATPLSAMSKEMQEAHMIEDLLYVLIGLPGTYIAARSRDSDLDERSALQGPDYRIAPGLDLALRDLTEGVLRMARHRKAVDDFVDLHSKADCGTVDHALSAAMRNLTSEYLVLVAQLEHQFMANPSFSLQSLALHIRPTAQSLEVLYELVQELSKANDDDAAAEEDPYGEQDMEALLERLKSGNLVDPPKRTAKTIKGGNTLTMIQERLTALSGDPTAREILTHLARKASVPYVAMLNRWIHEGAIDDPHNEFMVREQSSIRKERLEEDYTSEYWQKRYTLRRDEIPTRLADLSDKILIAGKYLNVVRECQSEIGSIQDDEAGSDRRTLTRPAHFDDPRFAEAIDEAYRYANSALLSLMLTRHEISARLLSMRNFFFLAHSDFFTGFQDSAVRELSRDSRHVNRDRLQSLLELSVNMSGSVTRGDRFKDDIRVDLVHQPLFDVLTEINSVSGLGAEEALQTGTWKKTFPSNAQDDVKPISGYQGLQFDHVVPFPVSLIISRKTTFLYQLLFRHLYSLRHTSDALDAAWFDATRSPQWRIRPTSTAADGRRGENFRARCWTLRARMAGFVAQVSYYCTTEVVDPRFRSFLRRLECVRTVDELMSDHFDFLNTCLKECMLTNQRLLRVYAKLLKTCQAFAGWLSNLSRHGHSPGGSTSDGKSHGDLRGGAAGVDASSVEKLAAYEAHFDRTLKVLLDTLNYYASTETASLLSLMLRLDWNKGLRDDAFDDF